MGQKEELVVPRKVVCADQKPGIVTRRCAKPVADVGRLAGAFISWHHLHFLRLDHELINFSRDSDQTNRRA
jgi:hypothetical protein